MKSPVISSKKMATVVASRNKGTIIMVNGGRTNTDKAVVVKNQGDDNEEIKSSCNATGTSLRENSMTLKHPDFFESKPLPNLSIQNLTSSNDFHLHGQQRLNTQTSQESTQKIL